MIAHLVPMLLTAVLASSVALVLAVTAFRSGLWTAALLIALWVLTVALRDSVDLSLQMGGIRVTALDVVAVLLMVVGGCRLLVNGVATAGRGLVLALGVLLAVHIVRGASEFGLQTSVNHARGWLYFAGGMLYAATFPGGWDRRVWKLLAAAGLAVAAISLPYLWADGIHPAAHMVYRDGVWITTRPITASGALLVLQAAILVPALARRTRGVAVWTAVGALAVVVAVEHRTVWVAALVSGVAGFAWWSSRRLRERDSTPIAMAGLVLLALPFAVWAFVHTGTLISSAKEVTSNHSTFSWRTTSWQELISKHHSASQLAGGAPSGTDWSRSVNGETVDLSPHDGFVDAYLRFGVPGVAVVVLLGFLLWRRRAPAGANVGLSPEVVGLLLLTQLVFSVAYTLDCVQGLIVGILVTGLAAPKPAPAPDATPGELEPRPVYRAVEA